MGYIQIIWQLILINICRLGSIYKGQYLVELLYSFLTTNRGRKFIKSLHFFFNFVSYSIIVSFDNNAIIVLTLLIAIPVCRVHQRLIQSGFSHVFCLVSILNQQKFHGGNIYLSINHVIQLEKNPYIGAITVNGNIYFYCSMHFL